MQHVRCPVALVASLAFPLLASSSASAALPEFLGTFPTKYTGSLGLTKFETRGKLTATCKSSQVTGEITGAKAGTFEFVFKECATSFGNCHTFGQANGTMHIPGTIELAYITKPDVGFIFRPKTLPTPVKMECIETGGVTLELLLRGGIITLISKTNTKTSSFELNIKQASGVQEYTEYKEGETTRVAFLEEWTPEKEMFQQEAIESAKATLATEKELEVMA
jgi:hypothetical protein